METREYSWETWQRAVLAKTRELKINAQQKTRRFAKWSAAGSLPQSAMWSEVSQKERNTSRI